MRNLRLPLIAGSRWEGRRLDPFIRHKNPEGVSHPTLKLELFVITWVPSRSTYSSKRGGSIGLSHARYSTAGSSTHSVKLSNLRLKLATYPRSPSVRYAHVSKSHSTGIGRLHGVRASRRTNATIYFRRRLLPSQRYFGHTCSSSTARRKENSRDHTAR